MKKQGKKRNKKYNSKRRNFEPQHKPENPMRNRIAELNQLTEIVKGNAELISRAKARKTERMLSHDTKTDLYT